MANWKEMLEDALKEHGETMADIEANTMSDADMLREFYGGFGSAEGCAFTVWTQKRVYFPLEYDGSEGVGSVSRNPDGQPTEHQ